MDERRTLLWVLRDDLGLTGTKFGCGLAVCGACTVLVGGEAVRSCATAIGDVAGKDGRHDRRSGAGGTPHPVQQAFADRLAFQCGYCTPGMIMGAWALLRKNGSPTRDEIVHGMDDHLCRCGAHVRIVSAIETAAATMKGGTR